MKEPVLRESNSFVALYFKSDSSTYPIKSDLKGKRKSTSYQGSDLYYSLIKELCRYDLRNRCGEGKNVLSQHCPG